MSNNKSHTKGYAPVSKSANEPHAKNEVLVSETTNKLEIKSKAYISEPIKYGKPPCETNQNLNLETAKASFEIAKMTYQNEYNRFDSIDMKFYYIFVIAGGLLATISFIFGEDKFNAPVYLIISFLLKVGILAMLGISLYHTLKGLITVDKIKTFDLSKIYSEEYINQSETDAIYRIVASLDSYIKENKELLTTKCDKFDSACKSIIYVFSIIGLKVLIDIIILLSQHIAKGG